MNYCTAHALEFLRPNTNKSKFASGEIVEFIDFLSTFYCKACIQAMFVIDKIQNGILSAEVLLGRILVPDFKCH